ncbi:hypothetical protein HYW59_04730 [Candidatus Kaiserbacteria bacterium]|nr:hypothetical protein [Candidatus Kaiserbacteria bacterium]
MTAEIALFAQDADSKTLFDKLAATLVALGFGAQAVQCPNTSDGLELTAFVNEKLSFGGFSVVPIAGNDHVADAGAATLRRVVPRNRAAVLLCPNGLARWRSFLMRPDHPCVNWRIPLVFQLTASNAEYAGLGALVPSTRTYVVPGLEWPPDVIKKAAEIIKSVATETMKSW